MTSLIISTDAPAVAGPPQGHWTYADWETLPDDGNRYEIIDPRARTLSHYRLDTLGRYATPRVYSETDTMNFDCLPAVALPIAQLFAGAPDTTL